jgi:hypothetical protein
MQLYNSRSKILPPAGYLSICLPFISAKCLRRRVPVSRPQTPRIRALLRRSLKSIMRCVNLRVDGLQQREIYEAPVSVDCAAPFPLGARDWERVGRAWRGRGFQDLDKRIWILGHWRHNFVVFAGKVEKRRRCCLRCLSVKVQNTCGLSKTGLRHTEWYRCLHLCSLSISTTTRCF